MTASSPERGLPIDGPAAPPRKNGELVFVAPWESRVFGLAVALCEQGHFTWSEFQAALIAEIARWEHAHDPEESWQYYARWQAALEAVLSRKGICPSSDLEARARALADRPAGHDH